MEVGRIPHGKIPSLAEIEAIADDLAGAGRKVYGEWDQGEDGVDEVYGGGGICHDVASEMVSVLNAAGVEHLTTVHSTIGENHVFVVALLEDGVYSIDIPPYVYEIGSGYVWKKKPDVVISSNDVHISKVGDVIDPDLFEETYCDA